jgi:hypothetical protein
MAAVNRAAGGEDRIDLGIRVLAVTEDAHA